MSRTIWKGSFLEKCLLKKKTCVKKVVKVWSRRSVIPSFFVGKTISVHNGKIFKKIYITRELVGYKFGEFCPTRLFTSKKKVKLKGKQKTKKK